MLSPAAGVPMSLCYLHNIPEKNIIIIIICLWTNHFYHLHYAYTFYTTLSESHLSWLEALGKLTQYCIIVTAMVPTPMCPSQSLTAAAGCGRLLTSSPSTVTATVPALPALMCPSWSLTAAAGCGGLCTSSPSVGIGMARLMALELGKGHWWRSAYDSQAEDIVGTPGEGKLHHPLGPLSREAEGKEMCSIYHFIKK